jgi:hypothetical protein
MSYPSGDPGEEPRPALPPLHRVLRETGIRSDMTEHTDIADGLASDRYVVVLDSGRPTVVQMSRAEAIERGLIVLDTDPSLVESRNLGPGARTQWRSGFPVAPPVDLSPGPPLRDLRNDDGVPSDPYIVSQLVTESSTPIRPELVVPVLEATPTRVAEAPVDLPVGNVGPDDAPPAFRRRLSHAVDPTTGSADAGSQHARPTEFVPGALGVGAQASGTGDSSREWLTDPTDPPTVSNGRALSDSMVRALDHEEDVPVPVFEVLEPARREAPPDVLRQDGPAAAVEVLPWQQPEFPVGWGAPDPVPGPFESPAPVPPVADLNRPLNWFLNRMWGRCSLRLAIQRPVRSPPRLDSRSRIRSTCRSSNQWLNQSSSLS